MAISRVIGREPEFAVLSDFLEAGSSVRALVLSGAPGIGKTTLWEAGIEVARERGLRVLSARPSGAEARLSFAALIDLFDRIETGAMAGLPAPQRSRWRWRCCGPSRRTSRHDSMRSTLAC